MLKHRYFLLSNTFHKTLILPFSSEMRKIRESRRILRNDLRNVPRRQKVWQELYCSTTNYIGSLVLMLSSKLSCKSFNTLYKLLI